MLLNLPTVLPHPPPFPKNQGKASHSTRKAPFIIIDGKAISKVFLTLKEIPLPMCDMGVKNADIICTFAHQKSAHP
jgi:hypothetical protein